MSDAERHIMSRRRRPWRIRWTSRADNGTIVSHRMHGHPSEAGARQRGGKIGRQV